MMYREPSREIPVIENTGVVVLGSGPAGIGAALAAARNGARVVLVEQCGDVGGVATTGLMSHWVGTVNSALYREIIAASKDNHNGCDDFVIQTEKLKTVLLRMLVQAGVHVRLYTYVSDVITENGHMQGVIIESKSGRQVIGCQLVIDATGDGDAAAKAGVPYQTGRPSDGHMQPMTLMCKVGGVEMERVHFIGAFEDTYACHGSDIQTLARQHLPHPAGHLLIYKNALPGVVTCNMTNAIHVDGTSAEDLTKATVTCRSQLEPIVQFLRTYADGFENCYLIQAASMIGVRETRHFEGAYCLNEQDILDSRVFDDWVVTGCRFNFDVHSLSGAGLDETGLQKYFPETIGYTIPYRSLLPKGVENLLLAGRNICGTHIAHSSFRVMPICLGTGEAAGTAAALSLQTGVPVKELDVSSIQQKINPAFFRERAAASH